MVLWKLGVHWLKSHRSILQKCIVLLVLVYIVVHHSVLQNGGSGGLKAWFESSELKQTLSTPAFAAYLFRKLKYDTSPTWIDRYTLSNNLLTLPLGPEKGQRVGSIDELRFYEGDPRLTWSVLLDHLLQLGGERQEDEGVAFSWYDWADFHAFNKLVSLRETEINCSFLFETAFEAGKLEAVEKEIDDVLFITDRLKYADPKWYQATRKKELESKAPIEYSEQRCKVREDASPKFNLPIEAHEQEDQCRPEVFELQSRSHLLNHVPSPLSMTVLKNDESTYRILVNSQRRENILQAGYLQAFLNNDAHYNGKSGKNRDIVFDHGSMYEKFLASKLSANYEVEIPGVDKAANDDDVVHLSPDLFEVDVPKIIAEIESIENPDEHDKNYLESIQVSRHTNPALAQKFFKEAAHIVQFGGMGYHRDKRFFNGGLINDPLEYQFRLNALIRNWLKFTKSNGLITWLAHGTVYGQIYNGMTFPWDNDFDVQMPISHLHLLSRYYNQSLIFEDPREGNGRFFLDVGTSITSRITGNGFNNIDARFIDVDSGLYVDITGLSVSSHPLKDKFKDLYNENSPRIDLASIMKDQVSPERGEGLASMNILELKDYATSHTDEFSSDELKRIEELANNESELQGKEANTEIPEAGLTPEERYFMNRELKVYNCRNNHFLTLELLSPLSNTLYHGVPALIPRKTTQILKNEYYIPKGFGFEVYDGKAYLPALHSWFNFNVLKRFANINFWNADLEKIESPINKVAFSDVRSLYRNMLTLGYNDLFTLCFDAFNATSYRYKEMEIQYDSNKSKNEKFKELHDLRKIVGPRVSSPGKDPYMFNYERRIWRRLGASLGSPAMRAIQNTVESALLDELWSMHVDLNEGKSELFISRSATGGIESDLNTYGQKIVEPNTILEADPF